MLGAAESAGSSPLARGLRPRPLGSGPGPPDHPRSRGVYDRRLPGRAPGAGSSPLARGLRFNSAAFKYISPDHPRSRGVYPICSSIFSALAGSSPLARGLPTEPPPNDPPISDHPRSRGVYGHGRGHLQPAHGSSPLARGLPLDDDVEPVLRGIIPARAGFTGRRCARRTRSGDHPRSRGVYAATPRMAARIVGSSPLARGLRRTGTGRLSGVRIIPARAGFTTRPVRFGRCSADHPRSRGVYMTGIRRSRTWGGSSPLARGLHFPSVDSASWVRIIPARAGFTPMGRVPPHDLSDHPRSRGVYADLLLDLLRRGGIIPARAGFTFVKIGVAHEFKDHPRSRGVYATTIWTAVMMPGSSPLARGLPPEATDTKVRAGIIPARAGFTGRGGRPSDPRRDHPRSRGVYVGADQSWTTPARIIPARAGFTARPRGPGRRGSDHPRSRGVYVTG